ncbi:MAG: hypothetical protein ACK4UK_04535 [Flavobacterium sp.]
MKKLSKILILLWSITSLASGTLPGKFTKQKTIKKSVAVNPNATLDIHNKYGNVMVTTWNENTIEIDVVIKLSSDDEKWIDNRLADINVDFSGGKSLFVAKTNFGKPLKTSRNSSIEVNYTVKIPKNGNLKVTNHYGGIITHDLVGETELECKYGKVSLGKLNNVKNSIKIDYCSKSTIEYINGGDINARYSGLSIGDFKNVSLNSGYSDVTFQSGDHLNFKSNYGKIILGAINKLEGSGNYLTIKIEELFGSLKLNTNYSNFNIDMIGSKAKDITINANYTNIKMFHATNYHYDFSVSTKYGNFKTNAELDYDTKIETSTSKSYSGFYKKAGNNQITINSNYGNVQLNIQ